MRKGVKDAKRPHLAKVGESVLFRYSPGEKHLNYALRAFRFTPFNPYTSSIVLEIRLARRGVFVLIDLEQTPIAVMGKYGTAARAGGDPFSSGTNRTARESLEIGLPTRRASAFGVSGFVLFDFQCSRSTTVRTEMLLSRGVCVCVFGHVLTLN